MSGIQMAIMAGGESVSFTVSSIGDDVASPSNPFASLTVNSNGNLSTAGNGSSASPTWVNPTPPSGSYWARLTLNSGTAPGGSATGSWIAVSGSPSWNWSRSTLGTTSANCTLAIASDSGGTNILASSTFAVSVIKE